MKDAPTPATRPRWRRVLRRCLWVVAALVTLAVLAVGTGVGIFMVRGSGTVDPSIRSTGQDAYWLGHAWVDGRKSQADVDALATQLEGTGIHDLFVHAGPFADDGTLDPGLRPKATWLIQALHTAIPGVRVQAWLGDVLADDRMDLSSAPTRAHILTGVNSVLKDGFDGVHYDFEPARNGDRNLIDLLTATHAATAAQHAVLSVATPALERLPGLNLALELLPPQSQWTPDYLRQVAGQVDQVAIMAYDSSLPSERAYRGYVRTQAQIALKALPAGVGLLIGAPAYHEHSLNRFDFAETVSASISGLQLALAGTSRERPVGVALYVDFTATADDWASYRKTWAKD
jgi:hypothetical protein